MIESARSTHGEVFRVGDTVAQRPDVPHAVKDRGVIRSVGDYGPFSVVVDWQGLSAQDAHVDRIALVEPGIFS